MNGKTEKLIADLTRERNRVKMQLSRQLHGLNQALRCIKLYNNGEPREPLKRRPMSAQAKKRIAAAQRARWRKLRATAR